MNSGQMPDTDFTYEEFEGLLASFYLTLLPLKDSQNKDDEADFEIAERILNGFADRLKIQKPEKAILSPRETKAVWGQPSTFKSSFVLVDMLGSFWRDFGVGATPNTKDCKERLKFARLILQILHKRQILVAEFERLNSGELAPIGISAWIPEKKLKPLFPVE